MSEEIINQLRCVNFTANSNKFIKITIFYEEKRLQNTKYKTAAFIVFSLKMNQKLNVFFSLNL